MLTSFFTRFFHWVKGPSPLDSSVWEGRLSPLSFRRFAPGDLPQCLEIYRLNEPGRFPEGVLEQYERVLSRQISYFLVAEKDGQILATGGMAYFLRRHTATLCFGLVHPEHQGRGIGTALLLARLALLNPKRRAYRVLIFAVDKSFGFYLRCGFATHGLWRDKHGQHHPAGQLKFKPTEILRCRNLLAEHGITVPRDEALIPFQKSQEEAQ